LKIIQKLLSIIVVVSFLTTQVISVSAISVPTPPPAPTQETSAPTPPPAPSAPSYTEEVEEIKEEPIVQSSPSPSPSPSLEPSPSPTPTPTATTSVANTQNGAASSNTGTVLTENSSQTDQNNIASVNSGLNLDSTTGKNNGSYNVGDTSLTTGAANTSGTIITAANTNVAGVAVSEFNVNDNHTGDIILSTTTAQVIDTNTQGTFQNNDGTVGNSLTLVADSGNNKASYNTGGNSSITTGDANVSANVLTLLNNNLAGNIIYGVVNIFGNLVGDIIFPEVANIASSSTTNNTSTFQTNNADIKNNLVLSAQTGDNNTSYNTGGNSSSQTGEASINTKVLNIANSNIAGGNYWLVIINQAGQWVGKILGAPTGSTMAGSPGTNLSVNEKGEVVANVGDITTVTNTTVEQSNNATVKNNINLSANSGGNSASFNTGGLSTIKTGDAKIIANLVNFVNNNIAGGGKLFVTVVNVFGSWVGDFVTPGTKKSTKGGLASGQEPKPAIAKTVANEQSNISSESSAVLDSSGGLVEAVVVPTTKKPNLLNFTQVAGIKIFQQVENTEDLPLLTSIDDELTKSEEGKTISINLAWLFIILPLIGITYWLNLKLVAWRRW